MTTVTHILRLREVLSFRWPKYPRSVQRLRVPSGFLIINLANYSLAQNQSRDCIENEENEGSIDAHLFPMHMPRQSKPV